MGSLYGVEHKEKPCFAPAQPPGARSEDAEKANTMLYTIALVLVILWVLGLVSSYTLGGLIHVLLVLALVVILVNVIGGRRR